MSAGLGCAIAHAEESRTLGVWQDYALDAITPDFAWAEHQSVAAPTALSLALEPVETRTPSFQLIPTTEQLKLSISYGSELAGDVPNSGHGISALSPALVGGGLERTYFAPGLTQLIGDDTAISASAVFVYQQFATWGMGAGMTSTQLNSGPPINTIVREDSVGSGGRLQVSRNLDDGIDLVASVQSRINMDAFQSYRGVFSDPGDFDIPAVAGVGLMWSLDRRLSIGVGVNRVMWSDVDAFTSAALPRSVLRLLGDGTSPTFAWRDLTVYDFDIGWRLTPIDTVAFTVTTHQQPEPTSALLRSALDDETSEVDFGVRYGRDFGRAGRLSLGASYAPAEYYFGNYTYSDRDATGNQMEVEAFWSVDF